MEVGELPLDGARLNSPEPLVPVGSDVPRRTIVEGLPAKSIAKERREADCLLLSTQLPGCDLPDVPGDDFTEGCPLQIRLIDKRPKIGLPVLLSSPSLRVCLVSERLRYGGVACPADLYLLPA